MDPLIGGAALLGGGAISGFLGSSAAKKQIQAMREALDFQKQVDARTYSDLAPYRQFGGTQLNALSDFLTNKNPSDFIDPGYDFRLKSGTNAVANNAAASGMLQSGDTLRALTQFGQDMGSQEYGNAFNRWLGEGQFRQNLAGMGQNAATQSGYMGNQAASNIGSMTANTDWGGAIRPWADLAGGLTGMGMNAFMGGFGGGRGVGGSNAFASRFTGNIMSPMR